VFVTIGVLTHDSSFTAWIRDLLCFELAWLALYRLPLVARWLLGVTAAVGVRALLVGHFSAAFYLVALAFTALFVAVGRLALSRSEARRAAPRA
jgi:predicted membrane protein